MRASSGPTSSITCLVLKPLTSCVVARKQVGGIRKKGLETDKAASGRRDMEASIAAALQMGRRRRYDICVTVALGKGKFRRTKVVRLEPQFMLHNRIASALVYKQHNTDFEVPLAPKSSSPLWWSDYSEDRHVCFRSAGGHSTIHWSAPVDPATANNMVVVVKGMKSELPESRRRRNSLSFMDDHAQPDEQLVRVDSQERGQTGGISVVVRDYNPNTPGYLIENHTAFDLLVWQEDVEQPRKLTLPKHQTRPFVWQVPLGKHTVMLQLRSDKQVGKKRRKHTIKMDFTFSDQSARSEEWVEEKVIVNTGVRPRGPTKVLRISSRPMRRHSSDPGQIHDPTSVKSTKLARALGKRKLDFMKVQMSAPQVVIALVDCRPAPIEVLVMSMQNLTFMGELEVGQAFQVGVEVRRLQVDNGNIYSQFPVIISPADLNSVIPFIQVKVTKSLRDNTLNSYPHLSVMIQEANLALDDVLLSSVAEFVTGSIDYGEVSLQYGLSNSYSRQEVDPESETARILRAAVDADIVRMVTGTVEFDEGNGVLGSDAQLQDAVLPVHCDLLELHPICVNFTFATVQAFDDTVVDDATKAFKAFAGILGVTLANIDNTPIKLNALLMKNVFSTQKQLMASISTFYTRQIALELYKILGTADLIGNPIGLATNLATGVWDFFYMPGQAVAKNPMEIGEGLRKGTSSLLSNTMYGSFNTVSKVTGTFGKGMAALSMDDDYLAKRKQSKRRARMQSEHLGHGMVAGVEGVGKGVVQGISGLITSPMMEVQQHGGSALLRGVGKGLVGAVVKPTVGIADFAEGLSTGMRNTSEVFEYGEKPVKPQHLQRFRPPRPALSVAGSRGQTSGALTRYDRDLAFAFSLIGKHEIYLYHARSLPSKADTRGVLASTESGTDLGRMMPEPEPEPEVGLQLEPEPQPEPEPEQMARRISQDFVPSSTFVGQKAGYAFKTGKRGLGYYRLQSMDATKTATLETAFAEDGVRRFLAKIGHGARTKGVLAAFVAAEYPPGDWASELIDMGAHGNLESFLELIEEDPADKKCTESFVMITDTRILVFPDVGLEPEVYREILVKDVRSLIMLDDALELHVSTASHLQHPPASGAYPVYPSHSFPRTELMCSLFAVQVRCSVQWVRSIRNMMQRPSVLPCLLARLRKLDKSCCKF